MEFPIIDISPEKWNDEDPTVYDEYIYTDKKSTFDKYIKNKIFCDGNGQLFKAIGKSKMTEKWRNWFRIIPNVWKTKIIFENMHKEMSVEELRTFLLQRLSELELNEITREWKINIQNAKTHSQLISGT